MNIMSATVLKEQRARIQRAEDATLDDLDSLPAAYRSFALLGRSVDGVLLVQADMFVPDNAGRNAGLEPGQEYTMAWCWLRKKLSEQPEVLLTLAEGIMLTLLNRAYDSKMEELRLTELVHETKNFERVYGNACRLMHRIGEELKGWAEDEGWCSSYDDAIAEYYKGDGEAGDVFFKAAVRDDYWCTTFVIEYTAELENVEVGSNMTVTAKIDTERDCWPSVNVNNGMTVNTLEDLTKVTRRVIDTTDDDIRSWLHGLIRAAAEYAKAGWVMNNNAAQYRITTHHGEHAEEDVVVGDTVVAELPEGESDETVSE